MLLVQSLQCLDAAEDEDIVEDEEMPISDPACQDEKGAFAPGEYGTDRAEDTVQKKPAAFGASNTIFRAYSGAASSSSALVTSPTKGFPPAESSPIC